MDSPLFNFFQIIILLGAGQGLFLAFVLFFLSKSNQRANRVLAFFLLFFSLNIGGIALYELRLILAFPHLALVYSSLALLFSPFIYFYVLAMTQPSFRFKYVHFLHGSPFLLFVGIHVPFFLQSAEAKKEWLLRSYEGMPAFQMTLLFATAVQAFFYLILCYRQLNRHERSVQEVYSDTERVNLRWLRYFLLGLVMVFGACVLFSSVNAHAADLASNLLFSVFVYIMAVYALRQPAIFALDIWEPAREAIEIAASENAGASPMANKYERSTLPEHLVAPALSRLQDLMEKEKIYQNPELKLTDLAAQLELSPHYLSQLLNIHVGENFYDFINRRRVEEFKESLNDPAKQHFNLLGLAYEAGFNSKAAFNNAFKKYTGMTPSEFRQGVST